MAKQIIYADNAATTKLDPAAFEAMKPFLLTEYGNASQPYSFSRSAKNALKKARMIIAECLCAYEDEIYFTSGATEANNWAIKCLQDTDGATKIITTSVEHASVLNACAAADKDYIALKPTNNWLLDEQELYAKAGRSVKLASFMLANNETGTIMPIYNYGADIWLKTQGLTAVHTDAAQAVGHIPVNAARLCVTMLSASAHKFNGPKGVGFLYIRRGLRSLRPLMDGGAQEHGHRAGTENIAGIVGMAVALKNNCDNMIKNAEKLMLLEESFLNTLKGANIDFILNGGDNRLPGLLSVSIKGADGEMLLHRMDLKGVCISTGSACNSGKTGVSRVISEYGVPDDYAKGTIRVSFGKYNDDNDGEAVAKALIEIINNG